MICSLIAKAVESWNRLVKIAELSVVVVLQQVHPFQLGSHDQIVPFPLRQGPSLVGIGGRNHEQPGPVGLGIPRVKAPGLPSHQVENLLCLGKPGCFQTHGLFCQGQQRQ